MKIKTNGYQTAFDLALIGYGSIEGYPLLVKDNPKKSITPTSTFKPGEEFDIISNAINRDTADYYRRKLISPISKVSISEGELSDFNNDFNNDFK